MFYQAHINHDLPIIRYHNTLDVEFLSDTLDAVYILSIGLRQHIYSQIALAARYSKKVIILNSKNKINFNIDIENVEILFRNDFNNSIKNLNSTLNPSLNITKDYDIPGKRNYALNHARENNYSKILLIDDDMVFEEHQLKKGISLLNEGNNIVGFYALNFADVSTYDHILREISHIPSKVSIGGNFLFLNPKKVTYFFPFCYNEDWIFILSNIIDGNKVASGGFVGHLYHEPWFIPERVRFETFGDLIVFGWKDCFKNNKNLFNQNLSFWDFILADYKFKCKSVLTELKHNKDYVSVIHITHETLTNIKSIDLFNFINNYKRDGSKFRFRQ